MVILFLAMAKKRYHRRFNNVNKRRRKPYHDAFHVFNHRPMNRLRNRRKKGNNGVYRLTGFSPAASNYNARYK